MLNSKEREELRNALNDCQNALFEALYIPEIVKWLNNTIIEIQSLFKQIKCNHEWKYVFISDKYDSTINGSDMRLKICHKCLKIKRFYY